MNYPLGNIGNLKTIGMLAEEDRFREPFSGPFAVPVLCASPGWPRHALAWSVLLDTLGPREMQDLQC